MGIRASPDFNECLYMEMETHRLIAENGMMSTISQ